MSWHRFKEALRNGATPHAAGTDASLWKKDSSPPDYTPMANASREAAQIMAGLGREQLAFAKQQYAESAPLLRQIADSQMAAQAEQMGQARDYYNYMRDTYRPVERSIVSDAMKFNTEAYRDQLASQAAADAGLAFNRTQQANQRAMASMGVNPNSGRFQGMANQSNLALAANRANAMTNTRNQAEQMGYARKLDAAGLGRGLSGASTAAYGGAVGAGNSAGQNYQSAGQNYMNNMNMGANTIGSGQQMQLNGLSSALNSQTQWAINNNQSILGDVGGLLGGAAAAKTAFFPSDRRLKENVKEVGVDQRTALTLYEFNYIGDDKRYVGVMADEVLMVYPEAVLVLDDGYMKVDYGALGIEFKELH